MKSLSLAATLFAALLMAGCTQQEVYPISGDACAPDDPVLDLSVPDCPTTI